MDRDEDIAKRRWMKLSFFIMILGFLIGLSQILNLKDGVPANRYEETLEHLHLSYVLILLGLAIICFLEFRSLFKRTVFSFLPESDRQTRHSDHSLDKHLQLPAVFNDFSASVRNSWDSIPAELKLAFLVLFDASFGLRYKSGILSLLINGDPLWILQFIQFVMSSLYILYWILNNSNGWFKTIAAISSPIVILFLIAFGLEQLFIGQEGTAALSLRLTSVFFGGLYWGAAYLAIAAGLTLTYKVQRFGNFAQAEMMLFGAYVGLTMMWSPFFYTLVDGEMVLNTDVKKDDVLTWDLLFWACVSGFVLTGLLGVLIDRLVYSRFRKKNALPQAMMIASLGVAMMLRGMLYLRYGADQYLFVPDKDWRLRDSTTEFSEESVPSLFGINLWPSQMNQTLWLRFGERTTVENHTNMDQTACIEAGKPDDFSSSWTSPESYANGDPGICSVTEYLSFHDTVDVTVFLQHTKSIIIVGIFGAVILLWLMLNMTRLGRQMRAVADNPDLAASSGINVERIHMTSAFLAAGLSGFGGVLFGMYARINPNLGLTLLLPAFSVIVLGSLGSIRGAVIAAVIVGMVKSISSPVLMSVGSELDRPSYSIFDEAMPYLFLIGVLMLMPKGMGDALEKWEIERARKTRGSIFSLWNLFCLVLLILCLYLFSWAGLMLWTALLIVLRIITSIEIKSMRIPGMPEIPYVQDHFRNFNPPQKAIVLAAAIFQIVIVSILDIRTSGTGTVYLLIDYVFFLLNIIGLILLYSSIVSYIPEFNRLYTSTTGLSLEQRLQILVSGLSMAFVFYVADYLVAGSGTIYLIIDITFLLLEASGLLLAVFILFFSRSELMSLFNRYKRKLKALTEIQKWVLIIGCISLTAFVYFLDTITSGAGILYYTLDLLYLVLLILAGAVTIFTISESRAEISHRLNLGFILIAGLLLYLEDMIEPNLVRETESKLYLFPLPELLESLQIIEDADNLIPFLSFTVKELAFFFLVFTLNDIGRFIFGNLSRLTDKIGQNEYFRILKDRVLIYLKPSTLILGIFLYLYVPFDEIKTLGIFFILYSINPLSDLISNGAEYLQRTFWSATLPFTKAGYGRSSERGSWLTFAFFLLVLAYIAWWLPSVTNFTKAGQISRIIILVCVFSILAFSLNLHTGISGMTNFGVIFFAGIGAITISLLTVPSDLVGGHGWSPLSGLLAAVIIAGLAGWLLAYPTAKLRMDYFAIVTISLGEIVRLSMRVEPLLRAGTQKTAIGITNFVKPLEKFWESQFPLGLLPAALTTYPSHIPTIERIVGVWFNLTGDGGEIQDAPYPVLLAAIALISFFLIWALLEMMLASPWGRILRSIREDEEVTMHHGHDVFHHKATSLAVGAAIAGFGGALWAWLNASVLDDFITPVKSTFLIWAAFIVGGRANNRGMVIGAFIIVLADFVFNLMPIARGDVDSPFHNSVTGIDEFFYWFVVDVIGTVNSDQSIIEPFGSLSSEVVIIQMAYLKLILVGFVILISLLLSERGLLPEVPQRPENPVLASEQSSSKSVSLWDNFRNLIDFRGRKN